ncbi:adenylyltransferase/cytidyltransferase family protein [bacterium]|nr:adenylyltransferase/cytidyltransferase family protein [bacterium]
MRREPRLFGPRDDPSPALDPHRRAGRSIVSVNGSFDLLHAGHLHILAEAARQGDVLVVGLNSDVSVRAYKGPGRPIMPESERAEILLALEMVDYVVLFDEPECAAFVLRVRPDVHVNDASYGENCIEAPAVRACGGRLHLVDKLPTASTTDILRRIKDLPA